MRIVFFGSGDFGLPTLDWLHRQHELVGVVTQPDKPAGRKRQLKPTAVGQWAVDHGYTPIKTEDCNDPALIEQVRALEPRAGIVIAFGQKLGPGIVEALGELGVNLHGSLLPKYRGAAPINWAVMAGESRTGLSVIELAQRMDAGRILAQAGIDVDPLETAGEVHDRLAALGPEVIGKVLGDLEAGALEAIEQDERQSCKAPKLTKAEGTVDFAQPAQRVRSVIHGLTPWPGCRVNWYCRQTGKTQPLTLLRVAAVPDLACFKGLESLETQPAPGTVTAGHHVVTGGGDAIELKEVQPPGGRAMAVADFARGHPFGEGDVLSPMGEAAAKA
jgi:methionyl-tRNA formyltransferase